MKTELTQEEIALLDVVRDEWLNGWEFDFDKCKAGIKFIYDLSELKEPMVVVVESPLAIQRLANMLNNTSGEFYSYAKSYTQDSYWVSFYDYFTRIGMLEDEKFNKFRDFCQSGTWFSVFLDGVAIVCGPPKHIRKDDTDRISALGVPALEWSDGSGLWTYRGIRLDNPRYHCDPSEWDPKWVLDESNVEIRRLIMEQFKGDDLFEALDLKLIDSWREYELYGDPQDPLRLGVNLLRMQSPILNDDTKPFYIGYTPYDITSARAAATWRNRGIDPEAFVWER